MPEVSFGGVTEASLKTDKKTRKEVNEGERPLRKEYLTMMKMLVEPTTVAQHGHTLGIASSFMETYCGACPAGASGMCLHISETSFVQYHHWTEGRPTPRPKTDSWCEWTKRGASSWRPSASKPVSALKISKKPTSTEEAVYRSERKEMARRNFTEGLEARYDQWGGNARKRKALGPQSIMFSTKRLALRKFFTSLCRDVQRRRDRRPWENIS